MYLKIIFSAVAREAAILVVQKQRPGETEDWKQPLRLACYVSVWHMIHFGGHFTLSSQRGQEFATIDIWYILADILRCPHNEVKNSQRWTLIARQLFTTHRLWYEFNIFLTSDYNKRWWDLYITSSTEYWNCKVGLNVRMLRAQFSRTSSHMLNVELLTLNVEKWSWKLGL